MNRLTKTKITTNSFLQDKEDILFLRFIVSSFSLKEVRVSGNHSQKEDTIRNFSTDYLRRKMVHYYYDYVTSFFANNSTKRSLLLCNTYYDTWEMVSGRTWVSYINVLP